MEFQIGDTVLVLATAREDVATVAWPYIKANPRAVIKDVCDQPFAVGGTRMKNESFVRDRDYALEWPVDFRGGISCWGSTTPHRGQFIGGQHLELCFEASREVNTVPNIDRTKLEDYEKRVAEGKPQIQRC